MRFTYPFQKVVDLKTNEKKVAQSELSHAIGALTAAEIELSNLVQLKERTQQELIDDTAHSVSVSEVQVKQQYLVFLEESIQALKLKIHDAEHFVDVQRLHVKEKTVDEKVWLAAREKAKTDYQTTVLKLEQNELDELATIRSSAIR